VVEDWRGRKKKARAGKATLKSASGGGIDQRQNTNETLGFKKNAKHEDLCSIGGKNIIQEKNRKGQLEETIAIRRGISPGFCPYHGKSHQENLGGGKREYAPEEPVQ